MLVLYDFEKLLDVVVLLLHESLRAGKEGGGLWLEAAEDLHSGAASITLVMGPVLRGTNHLTLPFLFQKVACFACEGLNFFASEVNTFFFFFFLRQTTGSFVDLFCCCYFPSIFMSRAITFCEVGPSFKLDVCN